MERSPPLRYIPWSATAILSELGETVSLQLRVYYFGIKSYSMQAVDQQLVDKPADGYRSSLSQSLIVDGLEVPIITPASVGSQEKIVTFILRFGNSLT